MGGWRATVPILLSKRYTAHTSHTSHRRYGCPLDQQRYLGFTRLWLHYSCSESESFCIVLRYRSIPAGNKRQTKEGAPPQMHAAQLFTGVMEPRHTVRTSSRAKCQLTRASLFDCPLRHMGKERATHPMPIPLPSASPSLSSSAYFERALQAQPPSSLDPLAASSGPPA